ncbi:LysR family transcriptional regulator [Vibrio sp. HN007]|uniref:LysR family transcriptional regulator n=1 Tax=Vibrio iocasae TaxID=3098914 RepID=UPI0035D429EB
MIDLNLLRALIAISERRNLKLAGVKLGLSESAVSKQLGKLREAFSDPLFERTSAGLQPTAFTLAILPSVIKSIRTLDSLVQPSTFDPSTYDKPVRIAMPPFFIEVLGLKLYNRLATDLPNAPIQLELWEENTPKQLIDNELDIAINLWNDERPVDIYQKTILDDQLVVCIASSHHENVTWDEVKAWPFVRLKSHGWSDYRKQYIEYIQGSGIQHDYQYETEVASFALSLMQTNRIANVLPKRMLGNDYKYIPAPSSVEMDVKFAVSASLAKRASLLNLYLIELVKTVFNE